MRLGTKKIAGIIAVIMLAFCGILRAEMETELRKATSVSNQTRYDLRISGSDVQSTKQGIIGNVNVKEALRAILSAKGTLGTKSIKFVCESGGDCSEKIKWIPGQSKSEPIYLKVLSGRTGKEPTEDSGKVSVVFYLQATNANRAIIDKG